MIKELLSEKGTVSCMRVMSLTCVLAAVSLALVGMNKPVVDYSGLALLCSSFLTAAFTGKIMQKKTETSDQSSQIK